RAELPVAPPHQYRQVRRGDLFSLRRRADAQYRPVLCARPRQRRQGHRAHGALTSRRAFELLDALAVVAAAALQPLQAAIGIGRFVGLVLIEASLAPRAARLLT